MNFMFGSRHHRDEQPPASPIPREQLPLVQAPGDLWSAIERQLDQPVRTPAFAWQWRWAMAAVVVTLTIGGWFIARRGNQWIETDASSRTRIQVGDIGVVDIEPNSRVRIIASKPTEHRLALARGEISAVVTAPPRLFFVETPSVTAVDLGCAYKMRTDEAGNGSLEVTAGWVELERDGRESLVPAGASCRMRSGRGPGTPYFADAPEALRQSLDTFDTDRRGLDMILATVRVRDTLTLWHLLSRVEGPDRERVFDRIVKLVPLPQGISRDAALRLDPETLTRWREELAWHW
jgi:hypothetical protein